MEPKKGFLKVVFGLVLFIGLAGGGLLLFKDALNSPSVILTDETCQPPCWGGITPGETSAAVAVARLETMDNVSGNQIQPYYDRDDTLRSFQWFFERPVPDTLGTIQFDNDIVATIEILTIGSITLEDSQARLGDMELIWSRQGSGEENRRYVQVFLFAPGRGVRLELLLDVGAQAEDVEIRANTAVFGVLYFDPGAFEDLLAAGMLLDAPGHAFPEELSPWQGYGSLAVPAE